MSRVSNKNILEINEITQDLKKSLILTPLKRKRTKNSNVKKTYILEENESFEGSNKNNNNESENEEKVDIEKYRDLQRKGLVYDSLDECDDEEISKFFIHPDSRLLLVLDFFIVICVFYDLIFIPLFLGNNDIYCRQGPFFTFSNIFNLFIDFTYLFDLFIHFFVGFFNEDDLLNTGLQSMFIHYMKHWFIVNFLGAIPFKTIFTIFDKSCQDTGFLSSYKYSSQFYYLFVCMRLVKTSRLFKNKFFQYLDEKLDKYEIYNGYLSFLEGFAIFCLTIHVVSCLFIFIGRNDYPNWIVNFNFTEYTFSQLYFLGIYYLITTVTTVGYGDLTCVTPNEKIFGIVIEIVGIVAYSWVLTSISNYVKSKNDKEEEYFKKYKVLEDIKMTYDDFSNDLFERIDRYIKHKHTNEEEERHFIEELPITLKNNLVYSMYEPIIQNFIFFKNFDNKDFIVSVIFAFNPILAIKNDILIKDGEFVEDIIFVKKGKITLELPIKISQRVNKEETTQSSSNNFKYTQTSSNCFNQMKTQATKIGNFLNNIMPNEENINDPFEEDDGEYQKLKILDIRKNEHFGDVLMFSNERSPLCAVVKSRKAELFYLNKKDAIEISKSYSVIWQKIQEKSIFNMKQITRLMSRLQKIFYTTNGLYKNKEIANSNVSDSIEDLRSIPTISDFENEHNNYKKRFNDNKNKSGEINNLKTIKEATQIEDDYDDSFTSSHNDVDEYDKKYQLENARTKKYESGTDSSRFNETSNKDADTIKGPNIINNEIDFSEKYSDEDLLNSYIMNKNDNMTPYKPDEINNEIYPNENFMKGSDFYVKNQRIKDSKIEQKTQNKSENNFEDSRNKSNYSDNNIPQNKKSKISFNESKSNISDNNIINDNTNVNTNLISNINLNNNNHNNHNNILKKNYNNDNQNNNFIKNNKQNNNVTVNNSFNLNNISMCSTEISFSINRKYENIDELSDYKYSKIPNLRKKIKSILKDYELGETDFQYNKYKTNKLTKKPDISYFSFLSNFKNKKEKGHVII